jgi:hypothetical protein
MRPKIVLINPETVSYSGLSERGIGRKSFASAMVDSLFTM